MCFVCILIQAGVNTKIQNYFVIIRVREYADILGIPLAISEQFKITYVAP